jgi:hypothetical protein
MIQVIVGAGILGAAGLAYTLAEQRLRVGDLAFVPTSKIRVEGAFKPFWEAAKVGLPDDLIEVRVSWRGLHPGNHEKQMRPFPLDILPIPVADDYAKGVVVKAGGAVVDVGFLLRDVVKFQRGAKTYKGGK